MLFCWLFTLLVMAAFTDMVAGTFVGKGVEGMTKATGYANSRSGIYFHAVYRCCHYLWSNSEKCREYERVGSAQWLPLPCWLSCLPLV